MEFLQIKCPKCNSISKIKTEILIPYSGKNIKVNCANPDCKSPLKIKVPIYNSKKTAGSKNETFVESGNETKIEQTNSNQVKIAARITVNKNPKTPYHQFDLNEGINTIGRLSMHVNDYVADIAIKSEDKFISKKHCQITVLKNKNGGLDCILKDAGSTNGTFLNNSSEPLTKDEEIYLNDSDTITVGDTTIFITIV